MTTDTTTKLIYCCPYCGVTIPDWESHSCGGWTGAETLQLRATNSRLRSLLATGADLMSPSHNAIGDANRLDWIDKVREELANP